MSNLGIVTIGRNEGERLRRCLNSLVGRGLPVVYVDSNSTDDSVELAQSLGVDVVELDLSLPFTAARARNAGFARLQQLAPEVEFVQIVDGDCEVVSGWLDRARAVLEERPDVAVVFGRRRERNRDQTIYNRLADLEWDVPIGEVKACGGDAMILMEAFRRVGGYNPSIIAAEDDELCLRIRREGWKVLRIDAEMTLHDMAMTRFAQWWRRAVRCGHAYAEGAARYGRTPERHFVRQLRSTIFWGLLLPLLAFGLAWPTRGAEPGPARWATCSCSGGPNATIDGFAAGPRRTLGSTRRSASWPSSPRWSASQTTGGGASGASRPGSSNTEGPETPRLSRNRSRNSTRSYDEIR